MNIPMIIALGASGAFAAHPAPDIQVEEIHPDPQHPTVPWVGEIPVNWEQVPVLFTIGNNRTAATGKVAASSRGLELDMLVQDPVHSNQASGADIWSGDCLQLGIDARGDANRRSPATNSGTFGPDDFALAYALTPQGAQGWVHYAHQYSSVPVGPLEANSFAVTRDQSRQTTHYSILLPWTMLSVQPGDYPWLGLAVQLNDSEPGRAQQRYYFGRGADGVPRPALFAKLNLAAPPRETCETGEAEATVWGADQPAFATVQLRSAGRCRLVAQNGNHSTTVEYPGDQILRRYTIRAFPVLPERKLSWQVIRADGDLPLASGTLELTIAHDVLMEFQAEVDRLLSTSPHPLFSRHLDSLKALVWSEWSRLQLYRRNNPITAHATLQRIRNMILGLRHDAGKWESYLLGKRELVMAYRSPHDGTLQYYGFGLPRDWHPDKAYPLFFELHGAGDDNPLNGVAAATGIAEGTPDLFGYQAPKTYAAIQRHGYWCQPFGRGNLGYRGIAETDIFEAYDDVHAHFKIDPDRRYLYGFSMGGGGTWSIGLRTPDRWAALAILAGGVWREKEELNLARNIRGIPLYIWCGEADFLYPQLAFMKEELALGGVSAEIHTTPGVGHDYGMMVQEKALHWLQQYTRQRPSHFFFATDADSTNQAWGFTIERNEAISGLPSIEVWVEGNSVRVVAQGTAAVRLLPGPGGLELTGEFQLNWNGREVYAGPVQPLLIDRSGTATPFDPANYRRRREIR